MDVKSEGQTAGDPAEDIYKKSADYAYEIIRDGILSGELSPGEKLSLRRMSRLTGASNIPVMQALHRLESEGIVQTIPYMGSRVIEFTKEIVDDRCALRVAVECQVARILARRLSQSDYQRLEAEATEIDSVDLATAAADRRYWNRHADFHMSLARATGYQSLVSSLYAISLFNLVRRAESSSYARQVSVPPDNHRQLLLAIHSGDPDRAERAARVHIGRSEMVSLEDF